MLPAITSELRKYVTTRMWWGMGIAILATSLLFSGLFAFFSTKNVTNEQQAMLKTPEFVTQVYSAGLPVAQILCVCVGVIVIGAEYRHKTATATFLATPRRWAVVVAKLAALTTVAVGYGLVCVLAGFGIGAAILSTRGFDPLPEAGTVVRSLALCLLVLVVWAVIGLGIGVLVRNQIAAILIAVGVTWIVEPIASTLLSLADWGKDAAKYFPSKATAAVQGGAQDPSTGQMPFELLEWWQGALVLVAYAVVMALVGTFLTVRRDIS